jgi:hypothetical protein
MFLEGVAALLLIGSAFLVVWYFLHSIKTNGPLNTETFRVSLYVLAGSFLFIIFYKDHLYRTLGISKETKK